MLICCFKTFGCINLKGLLLFQLFSTIFNFFSLFVHLAPLDYLSKCRHLREMAGLKVIGWERKTDDEKLKHSGPAAHLLGQVSRTVFGYLYLSKGWVF